MRRVDQNRICTPYMTVCAVISLLKIPYIHRVGQNQIYTVYIYVYMYGSGHP